MALKNKYWHEDAIVFYKKLDYMRIYSKHISDRSVSPSYRT